MHLGGTPPSYLHPSPRDAGRPVPLSPIKVVITIARGVALFSVTHFRLAHTHPANLRCSNAVHALPPPPLIREAGLLENHIHRNHRPAATEFRFGVTSVLDTPGYTAPVCTEHQFGG